MKKSLPLLFFFTCISCINNDTSQEGENNNQPQNESNPPVSNRDSVEYTKQYDPSKPEGQQTQPTGTTGKRKLYNTVFFLCRVKEIDKLTIYYTQYYNLEKIGFVNMELSINRLKDCITREIKRTYSSQGVPIRNVTVGVHRFTSQTEAEDWYFRYIKNMKAYPYNSECTDL